MDSSKGADAWLSSMLFNRSAWSLWLQRSVLQWVLGGAGIPPSVTVSKMDIGPTRVHWVRPDNAQEERVIVYLPGGGFALGSARTHLPYLARLCMAAGCNGMLVNHRLAPRHPYPAALHDAVRALQWVRDNHIDPDSIAIAGDGSGACLALAAMLKLRDQGQALPRAALLVSPWADLEDHGRTLSFSDQGFGQRISGIRMSYYASLYVGELDPSDPLISPLNADLTGFPPMLLQAGSTEVLSEDASRLQVLAGECGVESRLEVYSGSRHSLPLFAGKRPEADRLLLHGARFISEQLGYLDSYQ